MPLPFLTAGGRRGGVGAHDARPSHSYGPVGKLTHGADGVLLASSLSRANSTSPTQTRRNSPGRIAATLQCLNRVNSTGCIIARHSITLRPRPGLTVEIPEENKEEFCVELLTLMQQKSDGKKTARGSGELLLSRGNFTDAGSSAKHVDLDREEAGVVAASRGRGSVKIILPHPPHVRAALKPPGMC
ncbi:hypothetical protein TcBrA4_0071150 [Trypanosoma cruzi]|nr:hypothetical protein TcBrA4_0071150 [Trypanosoma cruzi]